MTYAAGQLIQASDYNGFAINNTNNVNAWWGTGTGSAGWGQTPMSAVNPGDTVLAAGLPACPPRSLPTPMELLHQFGPQLACPDW